MRFDHVVGFTGGGRGEHHGLQPPAEVVIVIPEAIIGVVVRCAQDPHLGVSRADRSTGAPYSGVANTSMGKGSNTTMVGPRSTATSWRNQSPSEAVGSVVRAA